MNIITLNTLLIGAIVLISGVNQNYLNELPPLKNMRNESELSSLRKLKNKIEMEKEKNYLETIEPLRHKRTQRHKNKLNKRKTLTHSSANSPSISTDNPAMRLIDQIAPQYGLRAEFVRAIACKESQCGLALKAREHSKEWDALLTKKLKIVRYSPKYESLMHSYGILQISGAYAYAEDGYTPDIIMDDVENIHYGCKKLRKHFDRCRGTKTQREICAAARHNGGARGLAIPKARQYAMHVYQLMMREAYSKG